MSRPEDALVKWRKERSLSQTAAGEMVEPPVSQAAWAQWESGKKPPGLHNAFELERVTEGLITAASWSKPHCSQRARARRVRPVKAATLAKAS